MDEAIGLVDRDAGGEIKPFDRIKKVLSDDLGVVDVRSVWGTGKLCENEAYVTEKYSVFGWNGSEDKVKFVFINKGGVYFCIIDGECSYALVPYESKKLSIDLILQIIFPPSESIRPSGSRLISPRDGVCEVFMFGPQSDPDYGLILQNWAGGLIEQLVNQGHSSKKLLCGCVWFLVPPCCIRVPWSAGKPN